MFDDTIKELLDARMNVLEQYFNADVIFYYGPIQPGFVRTFRDRIETLRQSTGGHDHLVVFLNTPGGSAEAVEKFADIIRFHYQLVDFVVPDYAMSAGTILCMSGDRIFMDYSSSLGPIDPQVYNGKEWVPALGYLDKVEELLSRARAGAISQAEFLILQAQDLATLSRHEQARDLTVTLLKRWLVQYKFQSWTVHRTDLTKLGQQVTLAEKEARAEQIAKTLGDHRRWHSHGRMISGKTLQDVVRLEIDDYSSDVTLRSLIRAYNDLLTEFVAQRNFSVFMHTRLYF